MDCPNCNSNIPENSKMCIKCGYLIEQTEEEVRSKKRPFRAFHKYFYAIIVFTILIVSTVISTTNQISINNKITPVSKLKYDINSIHYVNDLYISDDRHYNYMLNNDEKKVYDELFKTILEFKEDLKIDLKYKKFAYFFEATEYFDKISSALIMDHPELIQFGFFSIGDINYNEGLYIKIFYAIEKEQYRNAVLTMQEEINRIKNQTTKLNEIDKVKYVYDYIADNNKYGNQTESISQSAYSVFASDKSPVCAGYARASQILLQNVGITSLLAKGKLQREDHEWNFVKIDNDYYWYDVTQSNSKKYAGFLFSTSGYYSLKHNQLIPNISGKKYINYK
ncbi:MAG: transglutaminase domain-containing protein [Bacilli bacterium]|nr:transglutaminase domain-containing protein [Bacilli bacterium]MDD4734450.1 transglutaminase domain-containing protein [Bacilli bacterium]